jgi:hypothetical protein
MAHLEAKVLKIIQDEAPKCPGRPATYDAFVSYLQTIEDSIPERVAAQKAGPPKKTGTLPIRGQPDDKAKPEGANPSKDQQGNKHPANKDTISCFYCGKKATSSENATRRNVTNKLRPTPNPSQKTRYPSVRCRRGTGDRPKARTTVFQTLAIEILLETPRGATTAQALVDSGAEANFVSQSWVQKNISSPGSAPRKVKAWLKPLTATGSVPTANKN